jgi:putative Holliday junction resolvase
VKKKRIVALDVGTKKVGIARSDLLHITATPIGAFPPRKVAEVLLKMEATEGGIEEIVVGWPLTPNGKEAKAIQMVRSFLGELVKSFPDTPIVKRDERFTSVLARRALIESGRKKKIREKRGMLDQTAAALILQEYLDELS